MQFRVRRSAPTSHLPDIRHAHFVNFLSPLLGISADVPDEAIERLYARDSLESSNNGACIGQDLRL